MKTETCLSRDRQGAVAAIALLAAITMLNACGGPHPNAAAPNGAAIAVETVTVKTAQWPELYEATGTVRARTSAVLSSRIAAYVEQVNVQAGDRVRAGQTLATLDARDLDVNLRRAEAGRAEIESAVPEADNGIAAAQANLDLAQATFRRMDELFAKKSISNQELDEAVARRKAAQANYEMARARRAQLDSKLAQAAQEIRAAGVQRDYTRIAAPFSGVIAAKSAEPGSLAAPGTPLFTIEAEGGYRLEALVDASKLALVKTGEMVEIGLESLDHRVSARVSEIVPTVDAASRGFLVKIDLPALAGVRSGLFGRAWFPAGVRSGITVPAAALVEHGQLESVFVVEDGAAHMRLVTTGTRTQGAVEALSGLADGDRVIVPVPAGLSDGARVEVRP